MKIKEALEDGTLSLEDEIDYADMTEEEYKKEIERLQKLLGIEKNKRKQFDKDNRKLYSIIKEVREYIEKNIVDYITNYDDLRENLLEILNKGE